VRLLDRGNEPIATSRQSLNKARILRLIAERLTYLVDCPVKALIEVDKGVVGPDPLLQFLPGDQLSGFFQQRPQHLEGLVRNFQADPMLPHLPSAEIHFENAETDMVSRGRLSHKSALATE